MSGERPTAAADVYAFGLVRLPPRQGVPALALPQHTTALPLPKLTRAPTHPTTARMCCLPV